MLEPKIGPASAMSGTMQDIDLNIRWIFEHALRNHATREIVSRNDDDGSLHRYTYADFGKRVAQLAHALVELGVRPGDRVATFASNSYRHLELYYAVPMLGAVLHTTNIRLFPEQVCWVFDHAGDKLIFVDAAQAGALAKAVAAQPGFERPIVVMGRSDGALPGAHDYEALLQGKPETFDWPDVDEKTAAILCYTSATTGDPKGVAFTHRSTLMHAFSAGLTDALGVSQRDTVLPIVPMFHVNAWGVPFLALMIGAKLVMAGARLDPQSVIDLVERENVTYSLGVPTVWLAVRDELEKRDATLPSLKWLVIGGSACPPSLFDDLKRRGIQTIHAWGMTEMSPIGTTSRIAGELENAAPELEREELLKQGRFTPIVAWRLLDEAGHDVPHDGATPGDLWVRGFAVTDAYFRVGNDLPVFKDGWFQTGDVCTMDRFGYLQIVDRSKDLVKSGGEWISSVDLENTLMGHPAIREAAVIGLAHAKWVERPVAVVVLREGAALVSEADVRAWLAQRVAKWMVPDRVLFVDSIPRTGVGKFLKRDLREQYKDLFSSAAPE